MQFTDDIQLESFSEESTIRDSEPASRGPSSLSSACCGSANSLLRRRHSNSPAKNYSPRVMQVVDPEEADRRPFLPEIDPKGRMSTQRPAIAGLNNEQTAASPQPVYRTLSEVYVVRNSLNNDHVYQDSDDSNSNKTDDTKSSDDDDDDDVIITTPHPPSSGRRSESYGHVRTKYY